MKVGQIIGNVVSVRKVNNLRGLKLLIAEYLDDKMHPSGKTAVCVDTVSAGKGDIVLLCSSSSARMTKQTKNVCVDNTIVGIIESISSGDEYLYRKG